ncbi:MAG: acyl-CoA dehydrogenase family protein [Rhizobiaceae bacterium]|nr:acyl-CoA dehydrogenase family protein [Rhizobiaceae bacterium]
MMLTESQREIRQLAEEYAEREVRPYADEWDRTATFPMKAITAMAEAGLLGMTAEEEWGGVGADSVSVALAVEAISNADATVALVLSMANSLSVMTLMKYGTASQREQWLPAIVSGEAIASFAISEAHAGSNPVKMKTRAVKDGDRYIVSGEKSFISLGSVSRLCFLFVKTDPDAGPKGISCFLVPTDTPGFKVLRSEDKLGIRASDTCQLAFEDMELRADQMIGLPGQGYQIALHGLGASRIGVAAQAVGVANAAYKAAAAYAREREAFDRRLVDHQGIGFRLANMAMEIAAARHMTLHAARLKDSGESYSTASAMAKTYASEMCERVCSSAIQVFGANGYMSENPVGKYYRDARVFQIYEGTTEIQRMIIARAIADDKLDREMNPL